MEAVASTHVEDTLAKLAGQAAMLTGFGSRTARTYTDRLIRQVDDALNGDTEHCRISIEEVGDPDPLYAAFVDVLLPREGATSEPSPFRDALEAYFGPDVKIANREDTRVSGYLDITDDQPPRLTSA